MFPAPRYGFGWYLGSLGSGPVRFHPGDDPEHFAPDVDLPAVDTALGLRGNDAASEQEKTITRLGEDLVSAA